MTKRRIVIGNGSITGFHDEVSFDGLELSKYEKKRVSRIVPRNTLARIAFILLRLVVNDTSSIAAWTRTWPCNWIVVIDQETFGPFSDRIKAIEFEKEKIYLQGKLGLKS